MSEIPLLLVEDDVAIGRMLERGLGAEGYAVDWARDLRTAIEKFRSCAPQVVVLDRMLPDGDGADLCSAIRKSGSAVPICMLTARETLEDKLDGFEAGADDYLVKPFEFDELIVRLAVLRRRAEGMGFQPAALRDEARRAIRMGAASAEFTRREWPLISFLLDHKGEPLSRERLLAEVWDEEVSANAVDVYVGYLRRKIAAAGLPIRIETVRGVGFCLVDE